MIALTWTTTASHIAVVAGVVLTVVAGYVLTRPSEERGEGGLRRGGIAAGIAGIIVLALVAAGAAVRVGNLEQETTTLRESIDDLVEANGDLLEELQSQQKAAETDRKDAEDERAEMLRVLKRLARRIIQLERFIRRQGLEPPGSGGGGSGGGAGGGRGPRGPRGHRGPSGGGGSLCSTAPELCTLSVVALRVGIRAP